MCVACQTWVKTSKNWSWEYQRPDQHKMKILVFNIQYDFQILKYQLYQYSIWRILNKYQYQCAEKTKVSLFSTSILSGPKPHFGIGNQNQDQVSVLVLEPKLLLPKSKLPFAFLLIFPCYFFFVFNICHGFQSCNEACV